jgi:ParB-like chromosome segregation protein Spo0J
MQFKEDTVPLSAINTNDSYYRITTDTSVEDLVTSIEVVGLLNPPFLSRQHSGYRIVAGFRRINACQRLGWSNIEARILEPVETGLECIKIAVSDNSFQRSLNLIEISRSIGLIRSVIEDDGILLETATQLGLPNNLSILKKAETLFHLPWPIQEGVLSGSISLAMALSLAKLKDDDAVRFAEIFDTLNLSLNKQREILTLAGEIAVREDISVPELLEEKEIKDIIGADDLDRTQKTRNLRLYLKRRRFPELITAEKNFKSGLKKLKLGPGVQLNPPKYFEGKTYIFNLSFDNLTELEDRKKILEKMLKDPNLEAILKK